MAKRGKDSKSQSNLTRQIVYLIGILALSLLALALGFDPKKLGLLDLGGTGKQEPSSEVSSTSGAWYELYFTQPVNSNEESAHHGAEVEKALIRHLDEAQHTIDAALFEINVPDTTAALARAVKRGVKVRLVLDDENALAAPDSTVQEIIDAGAQYRSDERSALMHDKYFIVDGAYVWTGSTNITRNGIYNNNNNALLIRSQKLVENYQNDFDEMFIDGAFSAQNDTRAVPNRVFTLDGTQIETYFSPEDKNTVEARLLELVKGAQLSVRFMAFSFTVESIGQAMIERLKNDVVVEGLFETTGSL